jgi:ABC-type multidrug transport system ATPase subunit
MIRLDRDVEFGRNAELATHALPHPTVSNRHARITRAASGFELRDLGSTNGTFVNGERVAGSRMLRKGDRLRVGPFVFSMGDGALEPAGGPESAPLTATGVLRTAGVWRSKKTIVNDVTAVFNPCELTAVIGPSGCGKSSLIRILSARAAATSGSVVWNGVDVHRHFESIKHRIAFVPQRETLPELLAVREALTYTARLRLPRDFSAAEIDQRIASALTRVGLREQAGLLIAKLSGGQRKRAALANELLVDPKLLFLDEVTSGLDEATDHEVMQALRKLADHDMTIVCVTHTLANIEPRDSILALARGGIVAYHGSAGVAPDHFGVSRLGSVYPSLADAARTDWKELHATRSEYRARAAAAAPIAQHEAPAAASGPEVRGAMLRQLGVLLPRYFEVVLSSWSGLLMGAGQSLVIGMFLGMVFHGTSGQPGRENQLVFLLGVSTFWLGCNNAAKEIVKEYDLFTLERDINLRISAYVLSKVAVMALLGILEVLLIIVIVRAAGLTIPHPLAILGVLVATLLAGTGAGLFISAAVKDKMDLAVALVPIALIPQILLAEAIVSPLTSAASAVAKGGITAYWMYRAELQVMQTPGVEGSGAWAVVLLHAAVFIALAMAALWAWDRKRRM